MGLALRIYTGALADCHKNRSFDGTVHPLTSYVINYVKFLFDYQSTLKQLFKSLMMVMLMPSLTNFISHEQHSLYSEICYGEIAPKDCAAACKFSIKRVSWAKILQCLTVQSGNSSGGAPADSGLFKSNSER
ncbi:hypothetical protein M0R45_029958 [Rubus argutus]|uniref:Exocyst subunit Exo70 family protein n=1 Tax=Rubus argutus TaxID=59490 RepID=A0AAW1WD60_RUBAR